MKIAVVVPVLNQFEYCVKMFESVRSIHDWQPIIIPNYTSNRGVAGAWNEGMRKAKAYNCDIVAIMNDDIVLSEHTLDHMAHLLLEYEPGLITATDYRNFKTDEEVYYMDKPQLHNDIIDAPDFACFMITWDTYKKVGEFDESFFPAYFEDNDYVYRCLLNDIIPARSQIASFYHYGSKTQNSTGDKVVPPQVFVKNRTYYVNKWGGMPGEEKYLTPFNK